MNEKMKNQKEFGDFVRNTRFKLKLGLREFAEKVGISATYISKMEVGDYAPPKEENVKKMAKILKIDEDALLGMAGKISSDLQEIIASEPELYAAFLRKAKKRDIKKFLEEDC